MNGVHDKLKPFKCEDCQASFTLEYTLDHHIKASVTSVVEFQGPEVNFSFMSPKLVRTYPHIVEKRGITITPLILRLISLKSPSQSIKIFVKLDFFTNVFTVWFVFVYSLH